MKKERVGVNYCRKDKGSMIELEGRKKIIVERIELRREEKKEELLSVLF